jgi:hypothetical protein
LDDKEDWQFFGNNLGKHVEHGRHAMAMDEMRSSFTVTHWGNADSHNDCVEKWFPGVHSDVGGGYAENDLSNIALLWMIEESQKLGLAFRDAVLQTIKGDPAGVIHNSNRGIFSKLRSRPRNLPSLIKTNAAQFHQSAFARQDISPINYPPYHPTRVLQVGESVTVELFAKEHWNLTGVYMDPNSKWTFSSTGKWQDASDSCDWRGIKNGDMSVGDVMRGVSSFLGKLEIIFKKISKNESTDFIGTKRVQNLPWFTLVGAIANDDGNSRAVTNDGSPIPHQYAELCKHQSDNEALIVDKGGYFYCFPNDVWARYGNNRGSISLTVKRVG